MKAHRVSPTTPFAPSDAGSGGHRRAPRPVATAVEALAARLAPATLLAEVQRVWVEAVGVVIAKEAEPVGEREGTVTVLCSSAVWMAEIDLMGPEIAGRLNAAMGQDRVRGLRCTATRGRRPDPDR